MQKTYKGSTLQFSFTLTFSEFFRGNLLAAYSKFSLKGLTAISLFSVILFILTIFLDSDSHTNILGFIILPFLSFVLLPFSIFLNTKKIYKEMSLYRKEQTIRIDSEGFHIMGYSFSRDLKWTELTKFKKYKSIILISFGYYQTYVLPRRSMNNNIIDSLASICND